MIGGICPISPFMDYFPFADQPRAELRPPSRIRASDHIGPKTVLLIGDLRAVMTLVMKRLCFTALYFASICIVVRTPVDVHARLRLEIGGQAEFFPGSRFF